MTHRDYPKEELSNYGLTESMVRISVGLEHVDDIIKDLNNGLKIFSPKSMILF